MPKKFKGPITDGARDLLAHLERTGQTVPEFCERHSLERIGLQRALNGETQKISVDFALAVERATDGEVKSSRWQSSTRRWPKGAPDAARPAKHRAARRAAGA